MKSMETIQGNRIIAVFMGAEFYDDTPMIFKKHIVSPVGNAIKCADKLKYHTSWDWLMPVVDKIEAMTTEDGRGEVNYIVSIEEKQCIISRGGEREITFEDGETKIEATWKAVVWFIEYLKTEQD